MGHFALYVTVTLTSEMAIRLGGPQPTQPPHHLLSAISTFSPVVYRGLSLFTMNRAPSIQFLTSAPSRKVSDLSPAACGNRGVCCFQRRKAAGLIGDFTEDMSLDICRGDMKKYRARIRSLQRPARTLRTLLLAVAHPKDTPVPS